MDLKERIHHIILQDKLFEQGDRIVVAVSGGSDSTALLHLLFLLSGEWGWQLAAAHANHGFRPAESEREAEFVRRFSEDRGITFLYEELNVPSYLKRNGGNPQEAARDLRYGFLLKAAEKFGARKIALAHHADDQAETVLMRILRGTGLSGLAGISNKRSEKNVELIRPLLRITKSEILEDLSRHGIGYCNDSSNDSLKYTRNRIRLEALPYLGRYNPSLVKALNRLADLAAADDDFLERETQLLFQKNADLKRDEVRFRRNDFCGFHVALQRRFLKLILNYLSPGMDCRDFTMMERMREGLLQNSRPNIMICVTAEIRLIREYDEIRVALGKGIIERAGFSYTLDGMEGELWIPEATCRLLFTVVEPSDKRHGAEPWGRSGHTVWFDAEQLRFPLTARSRMDGDRMRMEGLNGSKKVKDIFIDNKVPAGLRDRTPILTDAEGALLWIPGLRRSELAQVSDKTSQALCIRHLPT